MNSYFYAKLLIVFLKENPTMFYPLHVLNFIRVSQPKCKNHIAVFVRQDTENMPTMFPFQRKPKADPKEENLQSTNDAFLLKNHLTCLHQEDNQRKLNIQMLDRTLEE